MREQFQQLKMLSWMVQSHRWLGLLAAALFCVIGWAAVKYSKDEYEVSAKVFLDSKSALRPLVEGPRGEAGSSPEQLAVLVKRTLLTRESILRVIDETGLRQFAPTPEALDRMVAGMTKTVKFKREMPGLEDELDRDSRPTDIYTISYRTDDAQRAKDIVEHLLNLFKERLSYLATSGAEEAAQFLDREIESYSQQLSQAEDNLKQFKLAHPDVLLNKDGQSYSERVETLQREMEAAKLTLRESQYRAEALRNQISAIGSMRTSTGTSVSGPTALDSQIEAAELHLTQLQSSFTEKHPDVIAAKEQLETLLRQKREGRDRVVSTSGGPVVDVSGPRMMLAEAEARVAATQEQIVVQQKQLEELRPLASKLPKVEAELAQLNRDYDVVKQTYGQLVQRREVVKLAEGAHAVDSMFKVVEPPRVPTLPVSVPRTVMSSLVFLAALLLGMGVAWLRAQGQPSFYTRSQLTQLSGLPVLGAVSMNWSGGQIAKRRLSAAMFTMALVGLFAAYIAVVTYYGFNLNGKVKDAMDLATRYGILRS
ncbi:MAG: XrtA system polysaccharide chain length determinant [Gammaproteobacteria bacterium]